MSVKISDIKGAIPRLNVVGKVICHSGLRTGARGTKYVKFDLTDDANQPIKLTLFQPLAEDFTSKVKVRFPTSI